MVNIPSNKRVGNADALRQQAPGAAERFELPSNGASGGVAPVAKDSVGSGSLDQIGQKLGELRRGKGMTQIAVAARMGTTQPSLARLEKNELNPNLRTLSRYASAIDVDVRVAYMDKRDQEKGATPNKIADSDLEGVPDKLSNLRKDMGFTQSAVADRLGSTQPVVARLESGEVTPNLKTLERFANAMGLEIELQFQDTAKAKS